MTTTLTKKFSVKEYLDLDDSVDRKHEYFKGEVVCLGEATEAHNVVVANLIGEVENALKGNNLFVLSSVFRMATPDGKGFFYPDLAIIANSEENQSAAFNPLADPAVIFEVMSADTKLNDKGYKFFCYKDILSLQESILIDSACRCVNVIQREGKNVWRFSEFKNDSAFFNIKSVDCSIMFDDLYESVSFES